MGVVPRKNIMNAVVPPVGENVQVKWSDGDILGATLLAAGKYKTKVNINSRHKSTWEHELHSK